MALSPSGDGFFLDGAMQYRLPIFLRLLSILKGHRDETIQEKMLL
jgi:hypothetical protein